MRIVICLALLLFSAYTSLHSQDITIKGRVLINETPAYGVNVFVQGTTLGTSTNLEGNYSLNVPMETESLTFSLIGYKSQVISIGSQRVINVSLVEDAEMLDEITVRGFPTVTTLARKRQENVQSIPESLVVFGSQDIENAAIEGIPDFINAVPNASFTSSQNIGTHALTVRGISQLRLAEAPVALVIDGINAPNPSIIDQELFDIEQIELVKGPQGALYGRNAIAGALNIITKRPTNEHNGFVRLGYGNGNTYQGIASSSGPIVKEKLLYRIAGSYKNSDGLITNDFTGQEVDFYEDFSVRGQLYLTLSDNFSADLISNLSRTEGGAAYNIRGCDPLLQSIGACTINTEPLTINDMSLNPIADEIGMSDRDVNDISLRLRFSSPLGILTSSTSYNNLEYNFSGDLDFSPLRELFQNQHLESNSFSQEIRLTSNSGGDISWILGGFYQNVEREVNSAGLVSSAGIFVNIIGLPPTDLENEILYPIIANDEENSNETLAFFGQASYMINKKTEITFGLRYDRDTRKQDDLISMVKQEKTFTELQPKFNISHRFNPNVFAFASYSRGYRSGGFNFPSVIRYPVLYDAETTNNYEIGLKTNSKDQRFIANFSAFIIDFDETQISIVELDGGGSVVVNLGNTRNIGGEVDIKYRVNKNFDIYAGAGVIDPKIIDNGTDIPDSLGTTFNFEDNFTPQVNLNNTFLALQYTMPIGTQSKLRLRAEHEHRGPLYWHPSNINRQDSREFVNLRVNFTRTKGRQQWSIGGFVNNLLDEDYTQEFTAGEFSSPLFGDLRWPGEPISYGINLGYRF